MILCEHHTAQYRRWRTTNVSFGVGYDPDIGTTQGESDGEDPVAYRQRAVENRRHLIRKQLQLIRDACEQGRGCTQGPRPVQGSSTREEAAS